MPSEQKGAYGGDLAPRAERALRRPLEYQSINKGITLALYMTSKEVVLRGRILKWGNSYGIRLRRAELKRAGLSPGSDAVVRLAKKSERVDLSDLPTFKGGQPDDALRHDELLAAARLRSLREKKA